MSNTASEIFQRIWEIASSGVAIAIYVVVFALILLWIVISLMNKDSKSSSVIIAGDLSKASDDDSTEAEALKELEDEGSGRFCKLCNLDQMKGSIGSDSYDEYITLRQFCENFRNYAASKLKLYYDISDIRRFVS
ncbi:MAG: hypothetical protein IJD89_01170, partial [Clostridia bacterium]|nr:hypothetical protein [Clostridia bacterium]